MAARGGASKLAGARRGSGGKRVSVCAKRRVGNPATVHKARFEAVEVPVEIGAVIDQAIDDAGITGRAKREQAWLDMSAEVLGRMREFSQGLVLEGDAEDQFEAVKSQPDMWEIRYRSPRRMRKKLGQFRSYHGEPFGGDPDVVITMFHRKGGKGMSSEDVRDQQNLAMQEVQGRYERGEASQWGHVKHECRDCVRVID